MIILNLMISRYKRCALIYLDYRLNKIDETMWLFGMNLPNDHKNFLSENEKKYAQDYKDIVQSYTNSLPLELDITKVTEHMPCP